MFCRLLFELLLDRLGPDFLSLGTLVDGHVAKVVDKVLPVIASWSCRPRTGVTHFLSLLVIKSRAATLANVSEVLLNLGIQFLERAWCRFTVQNELLKAVRLVLDASPLEILKVDVGPVFAINALYVVEDIA